MRTIIKKSIIILVSGILISFNTQAKENKNLYPSTTLGENSIYEIKKAFTFPNFILQAKEAEEVNVVFMVNQLGKVNLVIANTSDASLKKSIESKFLKLTLSQLKANYAFNIKFNVKTK